MRYSIYTPSLVRIRLRVSHVRDARCRTYEIVNVARAGLMMSHVRDFQRFPCSIFFPYNRMDTDPVPGIGFPGSQREGIPALPESPTGLPESIPVSFLFCKNRPLSRNRRNASFPWSV